MVEVIVEWGGSWWCGVVVMRSQALNEASLHPSQFFEGNSVTVLQMEVSFAA